MGGSELRKRSAPAASQRNAKPVKDSGVSPAAKAQTSSNASAYLVLVLLSAAAYFVYRNPAIVTVPLAEFLGTDVLEQPAAPGVVDFTADVPKRDAVVEAFKHAWLAYERDAMGDDEYHPISHEGTNLTEAGGIGYTVVDSIDTMLIMGLHEEYMRARDWVANTMTFERDGDFNTFETTIRVLGGLLSAYALTKDPMYIDKAKDLADRIMPAFDTPSGLPLSNVNLGARVASKTGDNKGLVSTAEVATLQLEFRYLSHLTGNETYWNVVEKVMETIKGSSLNTGLASIFMNPEDGRFVMSAIRLGSRGDSYYEYLLKQYVQTNYTEPVYKEMYEFAMNGVQEHLIKKSVSGRLTYTAELIPERSGSGKMSWRLQPKQDHLICFFGGSLMLGAVTAGAATQNVSIPPHAKHLTPVGIRDWKTGVELIETCMRTHDTATGLSPEIVHFRIPGDKVSGSSVPDDWYIKGAKPGAPPSYDARYILRPETVESLFIAYRLTGDQRYRDYGWAIFQAIEKHCKIETGGYASILNVDQVPVVHEDKMETFLMSETLKYLYLLFEDDTVLPLDKYVFNTEAHPLPIFNPTRHANF
ncbi:glycoside hydrolase [Lenzites betulinus]|nr:glycoside hydrolase [Lenzites betulinus]